MTAIRSVVDPCGQETDARGEPGRNCRRNSVRSSQGLKQSQGKVTGESTRETLARRKTWECLGGGEHSKELPKLARVAFYNRRWRFSHLASICCGYRADREERKSWVKGTAAVKFNLNIARNKFCFAIH
jgi:hypothetical protein